MGFGVGFRAQKGGHGNAGAGLGMSVADAKVIPAMPNTWRRVKAWAVLGVSGTLNGSTEQRNEATRRTRMYMVVVRRCEKTSSAIYCALPPLEYIIWYP